MDTTALVDQILQAAVMAMIDGEEDDLAVCLEALATGVNRLGGKPAVDTALVTVTQRNLAGTWQRGWQPADVIRRVRREHGARHARIAVDLIAAEMRSYAPATVDERWEAQLRALDATVWWTRDDELLAAIGVREGLTRPELVQHLLGVAQVLATCPEIETLCPPPGQARRGVLGPDLSASAVRGKGDGGDLGPERDADPRQLDRVRALLAKAESTTFPEEAEACTAKAQELMARYSIDYALLAATTGTSDEPIGRRIGVDNPYEGPKALLLSAVAGANRCQSVWTKLFGYVTVLGFPGDLDAVELLFTSLLVQATSAMVREGTRKDAHGRSSTRSFRQSFLTAYAQRIGERLAEATQRATEEATRDLSDRPGVDRLLPVLASREDAVRAKVADLFPNRFGQSFSITNREGWASGRSAADQAQLAAHRPIENR